MEGRRAPSASSAHAASLFAPVVSITTTMRRRYFWAAWWSSPPVRSPFLKPDASNGGARSHEEALAEACQVAGRELVLIEPHWARAWSRVLRGQEPWLGNASGPRVSSTRPPAPDEQRASLWSVLGVGPDASAEEVKRAYRKRALEAHPDRGGDPEVFRRVQRAYEQALVRVRKRAPKRKREADQGVIKRG